MEYDQVIPVLGKYRKLVEKNSSLRVLSQLSTSTSVENYYLRCLCVENEKSVNMIGFRTYVFTVSYNLKNISFTTY